MKYMRKPTPALAMKWTGNNLEEFRKFVSDNLVVVYCLETEGDALFLGTSSMWRLIRLNHWLVFDKEEGHIYTYSDEAFKEDYEKEE